MFAYAAAFAPLQFSVAHNSQLLQEGMTCWFSASSWSQPSNLPSFRLHCTDTLLLPGAFCNRGFRRNGFLRLRQQTRMVNVVLHVGKDRDFYPLSRDELDGAPYEVLPDGSISYLDEQDVVTLVDPPRELTTLDPGSYNPASYLWKKIGDIPDQRRHRLFFLLEEKRLIPKVWQLAGARFKDGNLMKKSASTLLSLGINQIEPEFWDCGTSSGPLPFSWLNCFRTVIFRGVDGGTYGRMIYGACPSALANSFCPLYFTVRERNEVMSTEQPCDLAYEFGDGMLCLPTYPHGFPKPVKHPWPFSDQLVIYIRHVGPGVLVGQAWLEGRKLDQVPKKFCGEILMVKDYLAS